MAELLPNEPNLHDAALHAWMFEPAIDHPGELRLDVDYILEWHDPVATGSALTFHVAPTTILFEAAWDVVLSLDTRGSSLGLQIELVHYVAVAPGYWSWHIIGNHFVLDFMATSLQFHMRQRPIASTHQRLSLDERGGLSFDFG